MDRRDRGAGVVVDAAGDHRHVEALGLERRHELAHVERDVDHDEVGAAAGAQRPHRLLDAFGVGDGGAAVHRDAGRDGELALQMADDGEAHGALLSLCFKPGRA